MQEEEIHGRDCIGAQGNKGASSSCGPSFAVRTRITYNATQEEGRFFCPRQERRAVLDMHRKEPVGVVRIAMHLQEDHNISYRSTYRIMKENGPAIHSVAKSRKRKWVRFERRYSNAMWHVDWHIMRDPRLGGLHLVTYLDDSSRCIIMAARLFMQATSENAVLVLRKAVGKFGTPATILSDNGSCFVGRNGRRQKGHRCDQEKEPKMDGGGRR